MVNDVVGGGVERVAYINASELSKRDDYIIGMVTCGKRPDFVKPDNHFILRDFRKKSKIRGVFGFLFNFRAMLDCLYNFKPCIIHIHAYIQFSPGALKALLVYKSKNKCVVIYTHHTFSYICPNDALFNYRKGCKCIKCINGKYYHILFDICYGTFFPSIGKFIQKRMYRQIFVKNLIDVHLTPSNFVKEMLLRSEPYLKIQVIYNPCIDKIINHIPYKKPGKIVCFGRISREKNFSTIIRIIQNFLKELNLTIIGSGPDSDILLKQIHKNSPFVTMSNIEFINKFITHDELQSQISDAQLFILPSLTYETSGLSIVEAINLGITPLVSNWGGMKETVDILGVGYVFNPYDDESIIKAIKLALEYRLQDEAKILEKAKHNLKIYTYNTYMLNICLIYEKSLKEILA